MSKASEARRNALYQRVLGEGRVRVGELARQLDVTTETIRKDLKVLEERGVLTKKAWERCRSQCLLSAAL